MTRPAPARRPGRGVAVALALAFGASASEPAAAATDPKTAALETELARTKAELSTTKQALRSTQDALEALTRRVDAIQSSAPAASPAPAPTGTARLAPVNVDNPAVSFAIDVQGHSNTHGGEGAGFLLGTGELFVSAPIDPFLRGYAAINGRSNEGFDIEEAALVTTSLPWNLTVKGGRFFADVGRLAHWHDEALPFVDRPPSLDRLIGGESGAEGVEMSWLAPFGPFLQITGGLYNSIGSDRRENPEGVFFGKRSFSELTYLVRPSTYLDLTDTMSVELGGTFAAVPQDTRRLLYGVDLTLRHQPGTSGFYQGTTIGAEWLWNDETFPTTQAALDASGGLLFEAPGDPSSPNVFESVSQRFRRNGGYAYVESFFARRFSAGVRLDFSQALRDDPLDTSLHFADLAALPASHDGSQTMYSAFLTWQPSEFQRLRLQGDQIVRPGQNDQRVTLQWTAFLGSHSHGFTVR